MSRVWPVLHLTVVSIRLMHTKDALEWIVLISVHERRIYIWPVLFIIIVAVILKVSSQRLLSDGSRAGKAAAEAGDTSDARDGLGVRV